MLRAVFTALAVVAVGATAWLAAVDTGEGAPPTDTAAPAAGKAGPAAEKIGASRLPPMLMGTGDVAATASKAGEAAVKPAPTIIVDAKTHTVRATVRFSRAKGVVEWVLSSRKKHPGSSVMLSENSAADFAAAFAKAGYAPGMPPVVYTEDRARPPAGQPVEIDVIVMRADGKTDRAPAASFISMKSSGEPAGEGTWLYVGPQSIREGDAEILVTELSGSVITTNSRDSSAMIFWMPKVSNGSPSVSATYYVSSIPLPGDDDRCEVEIRPAAVPVVPAVPVAPAVPAAPTVSPTASSAPLPPAPTATAAPTAGSTPAPAAPTSSAAPPPAATPSAGSPAPSGSTSPPLPRNFM
jgi:hypothetical protein